jgi:DOPA 4,5-dioxygenase
MSAEAVAVDSIESYHAHVYFDEATREPAQALRDAISAGFEITMGRWHERPVGPHPMWSYQVAFQPALFDTLVPWLMLNRGELNILLHPNTGEGLADHRERPFWLGDAQELDLSIFDKD